MRVLFVTHYGPSHVPWLVPLAWAAQLAGHEVRIAVQTQSVAAVRQAGLIAVPIGDDSVAARPDKFAGLGKKADRTLPAGWGDKPELLDRAMLDGLAGRLFTVAEGVCDDLVAFTRAWRPDVLVHDTGSIAALVAAAVAGVPAIGHVHGVPGGMAVQTEQDVLPGYARLFERFGVPPLVRPAVWIDPCPPSLRRQDPVAREPMRFVPFSGSAQVPPWLLDLPRGPRICVTGGLATTTLDEVVQTVLEGLGDDGAQVVLAVTAAQADALRAGPALPAGVLIAESFPLNALLPTCDAIVHHGGGGTTMIAVAGGLPQVILPKSPIQQDWARRVTDAGSGLTVEADRQDDPEAVRAAVSTLLSGGEHRKNAIRLREEVEAMPEPARVVDFVTRTAVHGLEVAVGRG